MSYMGMGRLIGVGIFVVAGAYAYLERQFNNDAVEATVYNIKRTCDYETYYENDDGKRTNFGHKTGKDSRAVVESKRIGNPRGYPCSVLKVTGLDQQNRNLPLSL